MEATFFALIVIAATLQSNDLVHASDDDSTTNATTTLEPSSSSSSSTTTEAAPTSPYPTFVCSKIGSTIVTVDVGNYSQPDGFFYLLGHDRNESFVVGNKTQSAVQCWLKLQLNKTADNATDNNSQIQLTFEKFDISEDLATAPDSKEAKCSRSYVKVFSFSDDSTNETSAMELGGVFCGRGWVPTFIAKEGKSVLVRVKIEAPVTESSLKIKVARVVRDRNFPVGPRCDEDDEGRMKCAENENLCIPKTFRCDGANDCPYGSDEANCPPGVEHEEGQQDSGCGSQRFQTGFAGVISSLNYPARYTSNLRCIWFIAVAPESSIRLNFGIADNFTFAIENGVDLMLPIDCPYDSLTIFSQRANSGDNVFTEPVARLCGNRPPSPSVLVVPSNSIVVTFETDTKDEGTGFRLLWEAIPSERRASSQMKKPTIVISDLEGSIVYRSNVNGTKTESEDRPEGQERILLTETWSFEPMASPGLLIRHFEFRFTDFDVPSLDKGCKHAGITFKLLNGEERYIFCNEHRPPPSPSDSAFIIEAPVAVVEFHLIEDEATSQKVVASFNLQFKVAFRDLSYSIDDEELNGKCGIVNSLQPKRATWLQLNHQFYQFPKTTYAKPGRWRWPIQLVRKKGVQKERCGGAIINSKWILTAASCFKREGRLNNNAGQWTVVAGQKILYDEETAWNGLPLLKYQVDKIFVHESYQGDNDKRFDIALVRLKDKISFDNETVSAVCLPSRDIIVNKQCTVVGWSNEKGTGIFQEGLLLEATMPIMDGEACATLNVRYSSLIDPESMMCAGYNHNRADPCQGFAGGALTCEVNGRWEVHGVYSWSNGCAGVRTPGVYTRVFHYVDWIKDVISWQEAVTSKN